MRMAARLLRHSRHSRSFVGNLDNPLAERIMLRHSVGLWHTAAAPAGVKLSTDLDAG
jgi:hypothetical protein